MEGTNVIFEVTKVGFAVNTKWNVFVDGKVIGKIDFKQNLTQKLSKGVHTVQFKVGVQKTQVLEINVGNSDIIVECVWDGTVKNFHVVGGEDNNINNLNNNIATNNPDNEDYIFCSKCGAKINKQSDFCSKCGNKVDNIYQEEEKQTPNVQNNQTKENNSGKPNLFGIIGSIIGIVIGIILIFNVFSMSTRNSIDGDYWFSDGSGYIHINKSINSVQLYDEYNNFKGSRNARFTDDKTFVYSDGLLEYTGTINGKKLTIKCENDKMGTVEATKK